MRSRRSGPVRPLRVAVLCSRHAPGLSYLLNRSRDRGVTYEIVCVVSTEHECGEYESLERRGVPAIAHPIRDFFDARGASLYHDAVARAAYDANTARIIAPFLPDLVLLDGYFYLVTSPLLDTYRHAIINLHFSDLTVRRPDGRPRFPGLRAVRDAIEAGRSDTRATVHQVNAEPDEGPPIVRSWAFPVSPLVEDLRTAGCGDVLKAYVFAHQQWMMRIASGPLLAAALRLIATGTVDVDELAERPGRGAVWDLARDGCLLAPDAHLAAVPA